MQQQHTGRGFGFLTSHVVRWGHCVGLPSREGKAYGGKQKQKHKKDGTEL